MSENQMTREQYVNLSKVDSLARQNAQQAVRIADLETQVNLLQMELNEYKSKEEQIPGEDPVEVEDLGDSAH
jgi:hypothetical protein